MTEEQEAQAVDPYEEAEVLRIMNGALQEEVAELRQEKYRLTVETRNKTRLMTKLQEQIQMLQSQITFLSVTRDAQGQPTPEEQDNDQDRVREGRGDDTGRAPEAGELSSGNADESEGGLREAGDPGRASE